MVENLLSKLQKPDFCLHDSNEFSLQKEVDCNCVTKVNVNTVTLFVHRLLLCTASLDKAQVNVPVTICSFSLDCMLRKQ